jgi:TrmH family RNA methyltransferase
MLTPAELDCLIVVLVGSRNPLNIGAAARAMSNFGFFHLRVVHPYAPAFRESRSAVDAEPVLAAAREFESVTDAIADCSLVVGTTGGGPRHPEEPLRRLQSAAEAIRANLRSGARVAILFGSEKVGLSNKDLRHCRVLLRIPTRTKHPSMNLGQSVAVVLYELIRDPDESEASSPAEPVLAIEAERERLISVLLEALSASGYHRLVRRQSLTSAEISEWLGVYRHLLWSARNPGREPSAD